MSVNSINLLSEDSFIQQQDVENVLLAAIVQREIANQHTDLIPNSWTNVNSMVDLGLAKSQIYIGDQFTCLHGNDTITWDVLGHNCETLTDVQYANRDNMTIGMHNCFPDMLALDAREAFYTTDSGLEAGTYNILISSQPWYTADQSKYMQFTLTNALPAGGQLVFIHAQNTTMFGKTFNVFTSSTSTTATETPIITEGQDGTYLGALTTSPQTEFNSSHRAFFFFFYYKQSAIRQWLNTDKTAGNWWVAQNKWDRAPEYASSANGFMYGMDEGFLKVVKKTNIKCAKNTLFEGGGVDEMDDYFFLLSKPQIYGGATVSGVNEGSVYPYFKNYSTLNAAGTDNDLNRIKKRNNTATWYWLRSPGADHGNYVWGVSTAGRLYSNHAMNAGGITAACTI